MLMKHRFVKTEGSLTKLMQYRFAKNESAMMKLTSAE